MAIPIVAVFRGDRHYLAHCIAQAKASNPCSEFILIGDSSTKHYAGIKHYAYEDYFESSKKFEKIFKYMPKDRPFETELFCFQRWLILNEFLIKEKIDSCFNIDADVMIYYNLEVLKQFYSQYDITLTGYGHKFSGHGGSSFVNNVQILNKLSDIIFEMIEDKSLFQKLEASNNVNEMVALNILAERIGNKAGQTEFPIQNLAMQTSITSLTWYVRKGELDKIIWKKGIPYGQEIEPPHRLIQFTVLHFHGSTKKYMWRYLRLKNCKNWLIWMRNVLSYKMLKYPKRYVNLLFGKNIFPKL